MFQHNGILGGHSGRMKRNINEVLPNCRNNEGGRIEAKCILSNVNKSLFSPLTIIKLITTCFAWLRYTNEKHEKITGEVKT